MEGEMELKDLTFLMPEEINLDGEIFGLPQNTELLEVFPALQPHLPLAAPVPQWTCLSVASADEYPEEMPGQWYVEGKHLVEHT